MPQVAAAASFLFGGGGFGAVTSVFGIQAGTIGFAALRIGAGLLLNTAISGFFSPDQSGQSQTVNQLSFPTSRPTYRFILGNTYTNCTPRPFPVVGNFAYGCWLVQSRVTNGTLNLYINNQPLELSGDPYDFDGAGATSTDDTFGSFVRVFIGRGDQTSPPQMFLDEAGYDAQQDDADLRYRPTDAGTGNTFVWIRMDAGPNASRYERWGSGVPTISVSGELTNVFDPRDAAQSLDDPSTWAYSDNQALLALDVLTQNPFRPYGARHLDLPSFECASDAADELIATKAGGTIKRYRAAGVVTFRGTEIEDIVEPIVRAGAGRLSRVGGLLGLVPGVWVPSSHTIVESLSDVEFSNDNPDGDMPTEARAEYSPETRPLESAETPIFVIDGALEANGGEPAASSFDLGWVPDHRQAQRVLKILALRARQAKTLSLTGLPDDLVLVVGENTEVRLPEPFGAFMNGTYVVESIAPGLDPLGKEDLALRSAISLRSSSADTYTWNAQAEEKDVYDPTFDASLVGIVEGGEIQITTGNTVNDSTGNSVIPRALFEFMPSPSGSIASYEVQFAKASEDYSESVFIDADVRNGAGEVFGYLRGTAGDTYKLRIRAVVSVSAASDWVEATGIVPIVDVTLTAPAPVSADPMVDEITVTFTASSDVEYEYTEILGSDTDDENAAVLIHTSYAPQGSTITHTETGLAANQTRYYFGRTRGPFQSASAFSASISATTVI